MSKTRSYPTSAAERYDRSLSRSRLRVGVGNENRPFAGQTAVLTVMGKATVSFSAHNHNPRTPRRG